MGDRETIGRDNSMCTRRWIRESGRDCSSCSRGIFILIFVHARACETVNESDDRKGRLVLFDGL